MVDFTLWPAPCNCKCIYCSVHSGELGVFDKSLHSEYYEQAFDIIDWAQKNGMIAEDARWTVSSGEITIHPYRDRIIDFVKDQSAVFFTNCFIFDEKIAANLGTNPRSVIYLSIDAGTPETRYKIKGVDNFDTVMGNLAKYFASSARAGQITLKYIFLPGINDELEEYIALIEIMKRLEVRHLNISCDMAIKYSSSMEYRESLIRAAGYLTAML